MGATRNGARSGEEGPEQVEERPGAPALAHDFFALALSAAESRWLRDALACAHVVVDVGAPEDVVRVPARENLELTPRALLALVSGWAEAAGLPFLPIVYGRGSGTRAGRAP